jgi:hypothetical protein
VDLRDWFQRANFARVKRDRTSRRAIVSVSVTLIVALLAANAVSSTIFGVLGQTAEDPAWPYALVLYMVLGIATTAAALRAIASTKKNRRVENVARTISGAMSGALLGFFYGGSSTGNNAQVAIASAVIGGSIAAILLARSFSKNGSIAKNRLIVMAAAAVETISVYGFAFLAGAMAIALFSGQHFAWGAVWGAISLGSLRLAIDSLMLAVKEVSSVGGSTSNPPDIKSG